jgi:DNA-binding MarR family transcriptional regulator
MSTSELTQPERVTVARLQAMLELLPTALDRQLGMAGLTAFEFTLLEALAEAEGHRLRLSALATRTNATLARLSRVVTSLERKGLVERMPCPADARATNAVLTEAGVDVFHQSRPLYAAAVRELILAPLAGDDMAQLSRLTLAMLTRLDPAGRFGVTAPAGQCGADPVDCPADPVACPADPVDCPADPPESGVGAGDPAADAVRN